jgi:glutamate carboxypeptidase
VLTLEAARANGDIVTARKATRWVTVRVEGKAAHAGVEPEKGRSATVAMGHILVETFKLNGFKDGMTVNPGLLEGGPNPNVVSSHAQAVFDLRAWSVPELEELTAKFVETAKQPWVPGTTVHVDWNAGMPAMERNAGTARLEAHAVAIAGGLGFPLKGAKTGGGSDVSFACHAGTPGLDGLGPIGGLDHGPDEYILHGSIVPRTALLAKLLQAIGSDKELIHG